MNEVGILEDWEEALLRETEAHAPNLYVIARREGAGTRVGRGRGGYARG